MKSKLFPINFNLSIVLCLVLSTQVLSMKVARSLANPFWEFSQTSSALSPECPSTNFEHLLQESSTPYQFDHYDVQTEDGPIIALFRVRLTADGLAKLPENQKANINRPMFLQHGLTSCADNWFMNEQDGSIGFHLADKGYDVWVGNNRGNKYSKKHRDPNVTNADFWAFSFDEMGLYDLPANYRKILSYYPKGQKIFYIAHSQGTTQMFAAGSDPATRDFIHENTEKFVAIEPIAFMNQTSNKAADMFSGLASLLNKASVFTGFYEILTSDCGGNSMWKTFLEWACKTTGKLCDMGWDISGFNTRVDNVKENMDNFLKSNPSGASVQSIAHFGQLISAAKPTFAKYDWGTDKNQELYGQATPMEYDVSNFHVPLIVVRGSADDLSTEGNLNELVQRIGTLPVGITVLNDWNHHTFEIPRFPEDIFKIIDAQL